MSAHFCQFSAPFFPLSTPVGVLLINPLSVPTLSWKTNKKLQELWKNKSSLKKTCIVYLFRVCLFIFQSLTQEYDDKITFKCHLLSYRDYTEKSVRLQLSPPPSPYPLLSTLLLTPSPPRCRHPLRMPLIQTIARKIKSKKQPDVLS